LSPPRPTAPQIASIPAAAAGGAFSVQVTSQRSEPEARAAFTALQQRYPQILGGLQPSLQPVTLPDRGTFYRVRIGQPSQGDATTLCTNLKAAGGDCIVQRN
jgi:cell division septation protein DedD